MGLGPTNIILDNPDGLIQITHGGAVKGVTSSKRLATLVKATELFDCKVERKGEVLRVLVNEVEVLRTMVHGREIGNVHVQNRKGELQVESLEVIGSMIDPPKVEELTSHNNPNGTIWHVGLVPTGDDGLLCLYTTDKTLFAQRSRDGGARWEDRNRILGQEDFGDRIFPGFSVVPNPDRDTTWLVYGAGKVNQSIYVMKGRSRDRFVIM